MIIIFFCFIVLTFIPIACISIRVSEYMQSLSLLQLKIDKLETLLYKINAETTCIANRFLIKDRENDQKSTN